MTEICFIIDIELKNKLFSILDKIDNFQACFIIKIKKKGFSRTKLFYSLIASLFLF